MRRTRVIPVLLIHKGGVYKTNGFSKPVYIGDPMNTIRLFNDLEVDEIAVLDIDASKQSRGPDLALIEELASEAFMPFAYGGGITTSAQARDVLKCGVEKVIINHAVLSGYGLLRECADKVGSQSVVASIDFKKGLVGGLRRYDHVSGKLTREGLLDSVKAAEQAGAGEILLNSVNRDGTMAGLDLAAVQEAADVLEVPLIICGGAGTLEHLRDAEQHGASAIAAGSMFVFYGKQKGILISYPREEELRRYLV